MSKNIGTFISVMFSTTSVLQMTLVLFGVLIGANILSKLLFCIRYTELFI